MRSRIKSGETFDYTRDENRLGVYMCWLPLRQLARLKPINKVRLVQWKDANVGSHRFYTASLQGLYITES